MNPDISFQNWLLNWWFIYLVESLNAEFVEMKFWIHLLACQTSVNSLPDCCILKIILFLFLSAECSFLRPNNSYQGWPSMKIFLTKTLNIWANRTICLQILFWIRDRGSFFFPSTNSRIHLAPQQHRCSIKIKIKTFKNFFNKIDNVLFKIRLYSNKSFWLSANRVAKLPCRRVCRQRVRF